MKRLLLLSILCSATMFAERPRLMVLTDIGGDPDDQQSLIRLMAFSNEFEIEGLIATAAGTRGELKEAKTRADLIREIVDGYGKVHAKLAKHGEGWPAVEDLRSKIKTGNPRRGREYVGEGHDTEGSRWIVARIAASTPERPLNISIWGGQTDLAQALWNLKREGEVFTSRTLKCFRVFDINDQDGIADWMRAEFPGMYYILSTRRPGKDIREGQYRGMYLGGDESLTSREWIDKNVRSTGPLGALYPVETWTAPNPHACLKEGDTPAWFFFLSMGGNDSADPSKPGWGGRFAKSPDGWYRDLRATPESDPRPEVSRWRPDFQKEFAKRMAWCRE